MYSFLFLWIIYGMNSSNYSIHARLWYTNFTEQSELTEKNVFVDSLRMYTVKSWINFMFIFSIITIVNLCFLCFGWSSTSSWQTPSSGEKDSWYLKKYIKKPTTFSILVMIIKCGTDFNIKDLNKEIVIFKMYQVGYRDKKN